MNTNPMPSPSRPAVRDKPLRQGAAQAARPAQAARRHELVMREVVGNHEQEWEGRVRIAPRDGGDGSEGRNFRIESV